MRTYWFNWTLDNYLRSKILSLCVSKRWKSTDSQWSTHAPNGQMQQSYLTARWNTQRNSTRFGYVLGLPSAYRSSRQWYQIHRRKVSRNAKFVQHRSKADNGEESHCEFSHRTNQLRTKIFGDDYIGEVHYLLHIALFAIRAATPSNCAYSPSQLAYKVDMIFCEQIHIN